MTHPLPDPLWALCDLCGRGFRGDSYVCLPCLENAPDEDDDLEL